MFDKDTLYKDYLDYIESEDALCEGFGLLDKVYNWESRNLTLGECMKEYIADNDNSILNEHWANWSLRKFGNIFSKGIRLIFINKIHDLMSAFLLYIRLENLTLIESILLKQKFEGKLPQAEEELRTKIVNRSKAGVSR